jgi:hypothetical protein
MPRPASRLPAAAVAVIAATVIAACGSSSPTSSATGSQASQIGIAQMNQSMLHFAHCMRSHGVANFPDPTTSPRAFKQALSDPAPAVQSAASACQHLLPRGGPANQSPAHSQAQIAAALAFARCMRAHGFTHFPDPSSSGQLTHQMLAAASIDIHLPAVQQAADACVSVTHGLLTRAAVARFVAGH